MKSQSLAQQPQSKNQQPPANRVGVLHKLAEDNIKSAPRALLEDLFEDYYKNRHKLYQMNLVRGIFFGFGSVIGGTIMIALLLWFLSLFNQLPFVGNFVRTITHSIESARPR